MKNVAGKIVLCTALLVGLAACTPSDDKESGQNKVTVTANAKMSSDALTQAGEQLVSPYTFHLADQAFSMALEKNPGDKKAQFYRAFLKRLMVTRGILNRVKPYAREYGNIDQLEHTIKSIPKHPLKAFLLDDSGLAPIGDLDGIQAFLTEYRNALQEFREFVAKNPNLEFEIFMNPTLFKEQIDQNIAESCSTTAGTDGGFEVTCNMEEVALVKMNVADLLILKQEAAGEQLYMTLFTGYSLKGLDAFFQEYENSKEEVCHHERYQNEWGSWENKWCETVYPKMSTKETIAKLTESREAMTLRRDNGMKEVTKIGADLIAAVKWAMKYQKQLCRTGQDGNEKNRKGFLFSQGVCIENMSEAKRSLALFDQILKGAVQTTVTDAAGREIQTTVDMLALFRKPVSDLRQLAPASYNACGEATALKDKTLGGMYPLGNAEAILIRDSSENCR